MLTTKIQRFFYAKERIKKPKRKRKPNKVSILKTKMRDFFGRIYDMESEYIASAIDKIIKNPKCYLTGRDIDLTNAKSYELDHIVPKSKGGKNAISNMGLSCYEANRAKGSMFLEDFINLCKEVSNHNS